ncbi:MAG: DUF2490 domain-containing protein [Fibrella sp.]|nr:DUF2490 domain-containing protein [Armatimonadota bacterium]
MSRNRYFSAAAVAAAMVLNVSAARAQVGADNDDFQSWNMLIVNKTFTGTPWRGYFEVQPRFVNDSDRLGPLLIRPAVGYAVRPNVSLWLGYVVVPNYSPRRTTENRYFQQLLVNTKFPTFDLVNRTRLEERFLEGVDDPSYRLRHFVRGFVPLQKDRKWAVVAQNELFWNLNDAAPNLQGGYDQNRTFLGVSVATAKNIRLETGYQYVNVRVPTAAPDRHLHTILTMLFLNY